MRKPTKSGRPSVSASIEPTDCRWPTASDRATSLSGAGVLSTLSFSFSVSTSHDESAVEMMKNGSTSPWKTPSIVWPRVTSSNRRTETDEAVPTAVEVSSARLANERSALAVSRATVPLPEEAIATTFTPFVIAPDVALITLPTLANDAIVPVAVTEVICLFVTAAPDVARSTRPPSTRMLSRNQPSLRLFVASTLSNSKPILIDLPA